MFPALHLPPHWYPAKCSEQYETPGYGNYVPATGMQAHFPALIALLVPVHSNWLMY